MRAKIHIFRRETVPPYILPFTSAGLYNTNTNSVAIVTSLQIRHETTVKKYIYKIKTWKKATAKTIDINIYHSITDALPDLLDNRNLFSATSSVREVRALLLHLYYTLFIYINHPGMLNPVITLGWRPNTCATNYSSLLKFISRTHKPTQAHTKTIHTSHNLCGVCVAPTDWIVEWAFNIHLFICIISLICRSIFPSTIYVIFDDDAY